MSNRIITGLTSDQFELEATKTSIAGFISEILNVNALDTNMVKLPPAPNGTVIYDSTGDCRGSGKATLDLSTEVDPKYGDIAQNTNEAVARAFEGSVKNGDFRFGDDGDWNITGFNYTVNNGLILTGKTAGEGYVEPVRVKSTGVSKTIEVTVSNYVSGSLTLFEQTGQGVIGTISSKGNHTFTLNNPTADRIYLCTVGSDFNGTIQSFFIKPVTEEVVINPVDMYGMEHYLEAVTEANPYVYAGGMPQTQATTMNGITTTRSNRPDTYYSVFDGDLDSAGLGVDFFAATDEQKKAMLSDKSNKLYLMEDGTLVQWRGRQRTIRGAGNGDWANVNPVDSAQRDLTYDDGIYENRVKAQGAEDTPHVSDSYRSKLVSWNHKKETGVFTATAGNSVDTDVAYNGECYFHYWGRVPRLNRGVKHPLNDLGTAQATDGKWYQSSLINTLTDCFIHNTGGSIASGLNGRDDGLFYDAIYPSGQGGVIDDRLSAWDMDSPEEAAKQDAKVKNGSFRGEEYLVRTEIYAGTDQGSVDAWGVYNHDGYQGVVFNVHYAFGFMDNPVSIGSTVSVVSDTGLVLSGVVYSSSTTVTQCYTLKMDSGFPNKYSNASHVGYHLVLQHQTNIPVEGNATQGFTCQTVYGPPEKILTSSLSQGWLGNWGGLSETSPLTLTRKALSTQSAQVSADGSSWTSSTPSLNSVLNEATVSFSADDIVIVNYTAAPYVTEQDINRPVLNGEQGLGSVVVRAESTPAYGALFAESLLHKVITNNAAVRRYQDVNLTNTSWLSDGELEASSVHTQIHEPVLLGVPANDSPAVKALMYQTSENQLLHLNYAYNEMAYDSVDSTWNDDSTISVLTGQTTYTNQGGVTLLAGTNRTSKPYGYSKNRARAGSQVDGVDL